MARQLKPLLPQAPSPAEWRAAMGYFPTGVTVVTTWLDGAPVGATVNALCSVSLDPPLLLICLGLDNPLGAPVRQCGVFGVNILDEASHGLARHFAAAPMDERFKSMSHHASRDGAPQLDAAPVFIDCVVEAIHAAGDHLILVGRAVRTDRVSQVPPLLYHKGAFTRMPQTA